MKRINDVLIDLVITWVNGNDSTWIKEKNMYISNEFKNDSHIGGDNRYKDQGLLQYWFRGVEKYAPWVNKIYFVTYGHLPSWLNVDNPKLVIVKHTDFIPKEYLPTFNSNTILLNLHRIKGLSEHFIFFNDDMFIVNKCKKEVFFKNGLPRDMAVMNPIVAPDTDPFWDMMINNTMVINKNFNKKKVIRSHPLKWLNPGYGIKNLVRNIGFLSYAKFPGFYDCHLPNAHLKSVFEQVWKDNYDICNNTCLHKFRNSEDITEWTMKYYQLAMNKFYPINKSKLGLYLSFKDDSFKIVESSKYKKPLVCLNDEPNENVQLDKLFLRLQDKSSYEN